MVVCYGIKTPTSRQMFVMTASLNHHRFPPGTEIRCDIAAGARTINNLFKQRDTQRRSKENTEKSRPNPLTAIENADRLVSFPLPLSLPTSVQQQKTPPR